MGSNHSKLTEEGESKKQGKSQKWKEKKKKNRMEIIENIEK